MGNKKVWWEEGQRWVKLRLSTKAIKTLDKKGIDAMAKDAGINLYDLPHKKYDPSREKWKSENPYPSRQLPKKLKSRQKNKWLLPNSLRGEQAWLADAEVHPILADVVKGKLVPLSGRGGGGEGGGGGGGDEEGGKEGGSGGGGGGEGG